MPKVNLKYKAFISYSHKDKAVARWLHRKLDGYSPPRLTRNSSSEPTADRKSKWRVFLDDEEFAAAGNLSDKIQAALIASENLIVVCSPSAAQSEYVNSEIRSFKRHAGSSRVFAVIAGGIPHDPDRECFPEALTKAVAADGSVTGSDEPIAADLQVFRRRQVLYKVISGILGVAYGDLVDRESVRRMRRIMWATGVSAGVAILLVLAGATAIVQKREAARNLADGLVQQGQRAGAAANLSEAGVSFRRALARADSTLARSGLIGTLAPPIEFQGEWHATPSPGDKPPPLTSVTFIDDTHVAVGDRTGTIRLVDLDTKDERWTKSFGVEVKAVSFSQPRDVIVAGLGDGRLISLSRDKGVVMSEMKMSSPILSLRHDRQGRQLVVGMARPAGVVVFDETGKRVFELQHDHAGSVQGSDFNAAGDYIYLGGSGAYIWACMTKEGCQRVTRVEDWVYSLDGSPDTRFTAYAAGNKIEFIDHAMQQQQRLGEAGGHIFALRFDPTSRYLAAAGSDRSLTLYDVRAQRIVFVAPAVHRDDIYALEFSPTAGRLVAVGLDGRLTMWKVVARGAAVPPYGVHPSGPMLAATQRNRISEIRITRDNVALVRTWDQRDRLLKIDPAAKEGVLPSKTEFADKLAASLDLARTSAVRIEEINLVKLWLDGAGDLPKSAADALAADDVKIQTTALSRDRRLLARVRNDGRADVFDRQERRHSRFEFRAAPISASAFMSATDTLLLGRAEGKVAAYGLRSGRQAFEVQCGDSEIIHLLEVRTRQRFIAVPRRGPLCVFDASGQRIAGADRIETEAVALSPDESMIASAGLTGDIVLLSGATLSDIARFKGHRGAVHAVHFTQDSEHLVSGGADETLRVWPAGEARRIAILPIEDLRRIYASDEPIGCSLALLLRVRLFGRADHRHPGC